MNQTVVIGPISDYLSSSICCKFVYLTVGPKNRGINDQVNLYSICYDLVFRQLSLGNESLRKKYSMESDRNFA